MKFVFALLIVAITTTQKLCDIEKPVVCGHSDISEQMCIDRGCCYKNGGSPKCFYPNVGMGNITKVHVIHGCHFDAGFVDTTLNIVNRYFNEIFPRVYKEAVDYEKAGGNVQMKFTTQSWLISLFYDCPLGLGINCPTEEGLKMMNTCIEKDWITWHAFPHVAELEIMDESLIKFGIKMSNDLKHRFNKKDSHFISQNDVPGTTSAAIPILKMNGIRAFRVNVVSQPPNVPNIYLWKDPTSGESILNLNHRNGYGGWRNLDEMVIIPGHNEAMLVAFNDDNQGPYQQGWLRSIFSAAQGFFPGASVVASTFDEFIDGAEDYLKNNPNALPTLEMEIGDTWLYGCASDPKKLAMMRLINRARTECEDAGKCSFDDARYYNFSRLYIFNAEHTWGGDIKAFLHDTDNWANDAFHKCLNEKKQNYLDTIGTWQEQRSWGFDAPLQALGDHELRAIIDKEVNALKVDVPDLSGYDLVKEPSNIQIGDFIVTVNPVTGALQRLYDNTAKREWSDVSHPIGLFQYDVYNTTDYDHYLKEYFIVWNEWGPQDFGKPHLDKVHHESVSIFGQYKESYIKRTDVKTSLVVIVEFSEEFHRLYGTPKTIYTVLETSDNKNILNFNTILIDKTPTRIPESMFTTFNMIPDAADKSLSGWYMDKLGENIQINKLDMQKTRGNSHQQGVLTGFEYSFGGYRMKVSSVDAGLIVTGKPTGFPCPFDTPDLKYGVSTMLVNNLWGVNYVMWYPFEQDDSNILFRYVLEFGKS